MKPSLNQVAIVTGAAGGIGEALTRMLVRQGKSVALIDRNLEGIKRLNAELVAGGAKTVAISCDVANPAQARAAIEEAQSCLGPIAILVNNAGVGGPFHTLDEVSDEEWEWVMGTNLRGVFLFMRGVLPGMRARGFGRIINIASIQGLAGATRSSTYVASKHGVVGYTKAVAAEWGMYGITCNAICPGYVQTAMGAQEGEVPDHLRNILAKSPVKRLTSPQEVASLANYLISEQGDCINGASLVIDGGITSHLGIT